MLSVGSKPNLVEQLRGTLDSQPINRLQLRNWSSGGVP